MFDTEKFISEVELRPALYDVMSKEYGKREGKAKCWNEICAAMFPNWNDLASRDKNEKGREMMKKWKALRDNFVRDYKRERIMKSGQPVVKKKRYVFYEQLQFLIPYVGEGKKSPKTKSVAQIKQEKTEESDFLDEADDNSPDESEDVRPTKINLSRKKRCSMQASSADNMLLSTTKNLKQILSESVSLSKEERNCDIFGNKAFLLSFLPLMDSLPANLNLDARMKITQVFQQVTAPLTSYSFPNTEAYISTDQNVVQSPLSVNTSVTDASDEH